MTRGSRQDTSRLCEKWEASEKLILVRWKKCCWMLAVHGADIASWARPPQGGARTQTQRFKKTFKL